MNTLVLILLVLLVIFYVNAKRMDNFAMYAPAFRSMYAPLNYNEDIAGIDEASIRNSTVNSYANEVAYDLNNPFSAGYRVNGRVPWDPASYTEEMDGDGQVIGRIVAN